MVSALYDNCLQAPPAGYNVHRIQTFMMSLCSHLMCIWFRQIEDRTNKDWTGSLTADVCVCDLIQISVTDHLNIPTHHPVPSLHTYCVSTHQLQRYLLGDLPLCYESTMSVPSEPNCIQ